MLCCCVVVWLCGRVVVFLCCCVVVLLCSCVVGGSVRRVRQAVLCCCVMWLCCCVVWFTHTVEESLGVPGRLRFGLREQDAVG